MKLLALSLSIILFIISVVFAEHEDPFPPKAIIYNQEVFKNDFLVLHNQLRREHDAADLVWDNDLQSSAQNWANNCVFKHSKGNYGENLATDYNDPSNSFGLWSEERQHYNFEDPRQSKAVTGHFTQVVWKGSQNLGCGAQLCERPMFPGQVDAVWLVVCQYRPPGNYNNMYAENVARGSYGRDYDGSIDATIVQRDAPQPRGAQSESSRQIGREQLINEQQFTSRAQSTDTDSDSTDFERAPCHMMKHHSKNKAWRHRRFA